MLVSRVLNRKKHYFFSIESFNFVRFEMKLLSIIARIFICSPVLVEDITIEMLNKDLGGNKMVFSEQIARIEVGDTITSAPTSKGHNVEMFARQIS